jgi:MFS transporter, DHA2 family, multidrug resistance protein
MCKYCFTTGMSTSTRPVLGLAVLALPTALVAIDISVLAVALPRMAEDLGATAPELLWMVDSYNFLVAGAMLTMGAVADRWGRRRVIVACAAVFALASAAGAFATTPLVVIAARSVMGIAGSALMPASLALIGVMFTHERARVQAMGAYMTVFLVSMAAAPLVGGLLLARWWWGSVFLIGVPVMLLAMVLVPRFVPEARADEPPPVDVASAAMSLASILLLVFALKTGVDDGLTSVVVGATLAGLVTGGLFLRRQHRLRHPLLDLDLVRHPAVGPTLVVLFLTALLMGGSSLFFNLYLQEVQGLTPLVAAVWMLPSMVAMIAAANLGPLLTRRVSTHRVVVGMLTVMTTGFACYALLTVAPASLPLAALGGSLATFGIGAAFPLLMDSAISAAPSERAGAGAALAQVSNELGIALGLTLLGLLGTVVYRTVLAQPGSPAEANVVEGVKAASSPPDPEQLDAVQAAFTQAFNVVGLVGVATMLGVLALVVVNGRRVRQPDAAVTAYSGR